MDTNGIKILIVDDELDIQEIIQYNLSKEGFQVSVASNGKEGLAQIEDFKPHLILLDIMMPEMDGVEVCRVIRSNKAYNDILIAFLTARNEDYSQIVALDVGGDDYITKPIRPKVLISRIKALLRRSEQLKESESEKIIEIADLKIDKEKVLIYRNDEKITLAKKEFELFCLLVSKPGKVFAREEIFNKIWGNSVIVGNRTIDVHIRKIREKVGPDYIKTIKGMGYKFEF